MDSFVNQAIISTTKLTERQKRLLKAIVEKYIITAQPIGSETMEREAGLGVSPATLRNEMAQLAKDGYLSQPHTSAGRLPTAFGFRTYINELMDRKQLPVKDEVTIKERLWDDRHEPRKVMRDAAQTLAEKTHVLGIVMTDDDVSYAGLANILDLPEFFDIDVTKTVLTMLDETDRLQRIFHASYDDMPVKVLFGHDLDDEFLEPCSFVFSRFNSLGRQGVVGVIGPARLNYAYVIPTVGYLGRLLEEVVQGW